MVDTLRLDTAGLRETATTLIVISAELTMGDAYADTVGGFVGHPDLAARLHSFMEKWVVTRKDMDRQVTLLAENLRTTAEAFESADSGLGRALTGKDRLGGGGGGGAW